MKQISFHLTILVREPPVLSSILGLKMFSFLFIIVLLFIVLLFIVLLLIVLLVIFLLLIVLLLIVFLLIVLLLIKLSLFYRRPAAHHLTTHHPTIHRRLFTVLLLVFLMNFPVIPEKSVNSKLLGCARE
jgi:hypothetical protein